MTTWWGRYLRWGAALVPGGARAPWTPPARQSTGTCTRQAAERAPAGPNMLKERLRWLPDRRCPVSSSCALMLRSLHDCWRPGDSCVPNITHGMQRASTAGSTCEHSVCGRTCGGAADDVVDLVGNWARRSRPSANGHRPAASLARLVQLVGPESRRWRWTS